MSTSTTGSPAQTGPTTLIAKVKEFVHAVQSEMKKVTWPTREELRGSTIVVIVTVIILSVFIGVVDRILSFGLERVLS
jgi:preprotein translocase subunit SecE